MSKYFALQALDQVSVEPVGDDASYWAGEELRYREWIAARIDLLADGVEAAVGAGLPLASLLDFTAEADTEPWEVKLALDDQSMAVTLSGRSTSALTPAQTGALRALLQRAATSPPHPEIDTVVEVAAPPTLERPFHLALRPAYSAFHARYAAGLPRRAELALMRVATALSATDLPLVVNGPHVRSGVDDHYFLHLELAWLSGLVIVKTDDWSEVRWRVERQFEGALRDV